MRAIKNIFFISLLLLFALSKAFAQGDVPYDLSTLSNTPDVANLINSTVYNDISLSSGTASFSIPVYSVKSGSLSLPISLSYSSTGFKPQQDASWVGLGWNLNAGGTVVSTNLESHFRLGQFFKAFEDSTKALWYLLNGSESWMSKFDTTYSFYAYSFPGHGGSFMYHKDSGSTRNIDSAYTFPYERLQIKRTGSWIIGNFTIKDDAGITYYFKDIETLNPPAFGGDIGCTECFGAPPTGDTVEIPIETKVPHQALITAYNLSRIVSANLKDTIDLIYRNIVYTQNHTDTFNTNKENNIYGKILDSIKTKNAVVTFLPGGDDSDYNRKDINGTYPWLDRIQVFDRATGEIVKNLKMEYGYFGKHNNSDSLWLKLKNVKEKDRLDSTVGRYDFKYNAENDIDSFPKKTNDSLDYFGYYTLLNHVSTNYPHRDAGPTFPKINLNCPRFTDAVKTTLSTITLPTGGSIHYEYEANDYYDGITRSTAMGTLKTYSLKLASSSTTQTRIDTLDISNPYGLVPQVIHIHYGRKHAPSPDTSTVHIVKMTNLDGDPHSLFDGAIYYCPYLNSGLSAYEYADVRTGKYKIELTAAPGMDTAFVDFSYYDSLMPAKSIIAPGVRLKQTTTTDSTTGKLLVTTYSYNAGKDISSGTFIPPLKEYPASSVNPSLQYCDNSSITMLRCIHNYEDDVEYQFKSIDTATDAYKSCYLINIINFLTEGTAKYNFYYHKVTANTVSSTDTLRTEYYFDMHPRVARATDVDLVKKIAYRYTGGVYKPVSVDTSISSIYFRNGFYTNYCKRPVSNISTFHDKNDSTISTTTNYVFDTTYRYIRTTTAQNSDSTYIITKYKHLEDYTTGVLGGAFKRNFILSPVVEQQQWKKTSSTDSFFLSGSITVLDTTLFLPVHQYSLETATPLTAPNHETTDGNGKYTTLISDSTHYFNKGNLIYNPTTGKLIRFSKTSGEFQHLIWGYNNTIPIAQIVSPITDTGQAYTSFEKQSNGGWTIASKYRDSSTTVTGDVCYKMDSGIVYRKGLQTSIKYTLSYWTKNSSPFTITGTQGSAQRGMTVLDWTYYEHTITGVDSVAISGTGRIDELRVYPKAAFMSTGTFRPLTGVTSKCDATNRIIYFEYDNAGRLKTARNQHREILKTSEYEYLNK